jgi:hypothetical protein
VAATKFLMENQHKKRIGDDASLLQECEVDDSPHMDRLNADLRAFARA